MYRTVIVPYCTVDMDPYVMLCRKSSNRYNSILMWTMGQIKFDTENIKKGLIYL
jgi:hypothetical protein